MGRAVLLDLGNVVLGVDFRRVLRAWAEASGMPEARFLERWEIDAAYREHEVGRIGFDEYAAALTRRFEVELPLEAWEAGWNTIWTGPYHSVVELLPRVAARFDLCAFTNTNQTHAECWWPRYGHLLASFRAVYLSSEIGHRKPDVTAFHEVCERMNARPDEVVFIDDTLENVRGGALAGLDARHVQSEADVAALLEDLLT